MFTGLIEDVGIILINQHIANDRRDICNFSVLLVLLC